MDNQTLTSLLAEAGSSLSAEAVCDLVAGVAAAPVDHEPDNWMALVAPEPPAALRDQLSALVAAAIDGGNDGLQPGRVAPVRLADLRAELARRKLDGFIVPHADPQQCENLPRYAERLMWLTGFTGSAGIALVLADCAALFVDGRYTLQVDDQVDNDLFERRHVSDDPPVDWIAAHLNGGRLGYDPWLHTADGVKIFRAACKKAGGELVACDGNPIDAVWSGQPPAPLAPVVPHPERFTGVSAASKRDQIAETLRQSGDAACLLSAPESVAWLLNIRGGDVPSSPLALGFAVIHDDARVDLFMDRRKIHGDLGAWLGNGVTVREPVDLGAVLDELAKSGGRLAADGAGVAAWIFERVAAAGGKINRCADPCALPKACKSEVELNGARAAHLRDGAALTRFLHWFDGCAHGGGLDEIAAADHLESLRAKNEHFRGLSFPTIAGSGPHGAIVHYGVTEATNRKLEPGELFLVDSGGQYLDGTTDVTRTLAVGEPSEAQRRHFTAVLQGHIALGSARFPAGTTGHQLDILARQALWRLGLDYDHGTGHGVGSYLGVHEGPQGISKRPNKIALAPGMIVSNEPGYYETGAYGIRIENLVCVIEPGAGKDEERMLAFETLTLAPIDRRLIDANQLTDGEIQWLDEYHASVCEALTPLLDTETATWLARVTMPIND
jgi:Xaa-Pro aminopeptidase